MSRVLKSQSALSDVPYEIKVHALQQQPQPAQQAQQQQPLAAASTAGAAATAVCGSETGE